MAKGCSLASDAVDRVGELALCDVADFGQEVVGIGEAVDTGADAN